MISVKRRFSVFLQATFADFWGNGWRKSLTHHQLVFQVDMFVLCCNPGLWPPYGRQLPQNTPFALQEYKYTSLIPLSRKPILLPAANSLRAVNVHNVLIATKLTFWKKKKTRFPPQKKTISPKQFLNVPKKKHDFPPKKKKHPSPPTTKTLPLLARWKTTHSCHHRGWPWYLSEAPLKSWLMDVMITSWGNGRLGNPHDLQGFWEHPVVYPIIYRVFLKNIQKVVGCLGFSEIIHQTWLGNALNSSFFTRWDRLSKSCYVSWKESLPWNTMIPHL